MRMEVTMKRREGCGGEGCGSRRQLERGGELTGEAAVSMEKERC